MIVIRGVDMDVLERDHDAVREEARELMRSVQEKSAECAVDRKVSCRSLANLASVLFSRSSFQGVGKKKIGDTMLYFSV